MNAKIFKKSSFSTTLLLSFCFLLVIGTLVTELFQAPIQANREINQYRMLFTANDLPTFDKITFTNRLGAFSFEKNKHNYDENNWEMTSPRQLKVQEKTLEQIVNVFEKIQIRGVLDRDAINISNFNFESPYLRFDYVSKDGKKDALIIGMVNPIDESAYAMIESRNAIYHIDALEGHFEKLDLSDFVESRLFTFKNDAINEINLYRGTPSDSHRVLTFKRSNEGWIDHEGQGLIAEKIDEFLNEVKSIRSLLILDKQTDKLQEKVKQSESSPLYFMSFVMDDNTQIEYAFSQPLTNLPDIRMEKRQGIIVKRIDEEVATLIAREATNFFGNLNIRNFRKLMIKKLFY